MWIILIQNDMYTRDCDIYCECVRGSDVSAYAAGNKRIGSKSARRETDRPVTDPRNQPIPITGRSIGASLVKEELNDDSCDSAPSGNTEKATQLLLIYFLTPWQHKTALWFAIRRCLNNTLFNYKLMTLCVLAFHLHNNGIWEPENTNFTGLLCIIQSF